ncbi:MAG TPA: putative ABC exporter domain-containing protein [Opitutaceae bacterium]|nr:putative ABC exporter domain-containing protein [Opitutaceae bacterium]
MLSALLYLRLTSARNWLLGRLRRLRQPRYLLGAAAGAAYFWFFVFRSLFLHSADDGRHRALPPELQALPLLGVIVPLGMILGIRVVSAWLAPDKPGLGFTEAEVAFLFPAPMTRRTLVHFKLLSTQVTILVSSLFFTLISNRGRIFGGNLFTHAFGWWIMFSTVSLHATGASFTVTRLIDGGVSRRMRQAGVTAVIVLLLAAAGYTLWHSAPALTPAEEASPMGLFSYALRVARIGPLYWVTLPFRILLGPFAAADWREFLLALGPALLLLAAHYVWVMRAETSFEEASIALAERRARLIATAQAGGSRFGRPPDAGRRAPFTLASTGGRPETAFLWKNLLSTHGFFRPRTLGIAAGLLLVVTGWLRHGTEDQRTALELIGGIAMIAGIYTLLFGPQFARQDFRRDLVQADLLKTYPLAGWQVVLGELLTPVCILTGMLWLFILALALAAGSFPGEGGELELSVAARATLALCLALIAPAVCLLQLMVPNAATLLFPSWAQSTRARDRGFDAMGQRLIFVAGQVLVIAVALLPAAVAGVLAWFAATRIFGLDPVSAVAFATPGVLVILGGEIALGLWWLGWRFERIDLSLEAVK